MTVDSTVTKVKTPVIGAVQKDVVRDGKVVVPKGTNRHLPTTCRESVKSIQELRALTAEFHKLRKYRNSLLHSVLVELKAGGEVVGILRSNPKPIVDTETGENRF